MTELAEYMQTNRQEQSQHVWNLVFGQRQAEKASVCISACTLEHDVKQRWNCGMKKMQSLPQSTNYELIQ